MPAESTPWEAEQRKPTPAELDAWLDAEFEEAMSKLHVVWQHRGERLIQRVRDELARW